MTYPDNWPGIVKSNDCSSIQGNYSIKGEGATSSDNSGINPTLFGLFRRAAPNTSTKIQLSLNDEQTLLSVKAIGKDSVEREFSKSVKCMNGTLVYDKIIEGCADGTCSSGNSRMFLNKADDGSLIARVSGKITFSSLLFKWHDEYDSIYRFKAIQ